MVLVADNTRSTEIADIYRKLGLTVAKFSEKIGYKSTTVHNWVYGLSNRVPDDALARARKLLEVNEIGPFTIPASQLLIPVPHIGTVSASSPVDWTDPFESETFEYVPPEMGDPRGRFSCRVGGDSMYDSLWPNDIVVFQKDPIPRLGHIILFRSFDNRITIKELKHNGKGYILHPHNQAYEDVAAEGSVVAYLVGIIRQIGSKRVTVYDANGIRGD